MWYVMYNGNRSEEVSYNPKIKRVREIIYKNGGYYCSCKQFIQLGCCCRHIFALGIPMATYCFRVLSLSVYAFYALREGTTEKMNGVFKKL